MGGTPVVAPETDLTTDVDAILALVSEQTRVVFLANPNNPTGTYLPFKEVRRLHAGLAAATCCWCSTRPMPNMSAATITRAASSLPAARRNVVMTRTFSKIYGLAGLRIGWCYGPAPVIDALNRIRGPFNVSSAAIAAGAAALGDTRPCRARRRAQCGVAAEGERGARPRSA